ncbi:MAG: DUF4234 domain-containing protein [Firmicutes bacterium]|nr:DUF4234 domain-containing protein [Bacillota bacterium]
MMWYSEASGGMILWGIFTILAGLVMMAGFLITGIGAFAKQKVTVGIGAAVLTISYVFSIIREGIGAFVYTGIGFLFLNILGLVLLLMMTIAVFADFRPLNVFMTQWTPVAMLVPIGLFLLTLIVAAAGFGLSAGTFFYNLAENLAQTGMVVIIGTLISDWSRCVQRQEGDDKMVQNEGYRNVLLVVLFSVITCGIYIFYWVYKVSDKLNNYLMTGKSAGVQTALFIFIPFYNLYWIYTTTQNINEYGSRRGRPADSVMAPVNLIVTLVGLIIVAIALMQDMLNKAIVGIENPAGRSNPEGYYGQQNYYDQSGNDSSQGYDSRQNRTNETNRSKRNDSNIGETNRYDAGTTHVGVGYYYAGNVREEVSEDVPEAEFDRVEESDGYEFEMVDKPEMEEREEIGISITDEYEDYKVSDEDEKLFDEPVFELVSELEEEQRIARAAEGIKAGHEKPAEQSDGQGVPYEELRKLKRLLDEGIITKEEFEKLKAKFI